MTTPPLPESPVVRARLDHTQTDGFKAGSRIFLGYSGAAPTAANCATLASDIATAWTNWIAGAVHPDWALTEVDVLDIASNAGASGVWTGSIPGTSSGEAPQAQSCMNVEFQILRRYRGGKPRIFLPPSSANNMTDPAHWNSAIQDTVNSGVASFFSDIEALVIGAMGSLTHVNVSFYEGFQNITNSSGRTRAAPTYRTKALVDTVTGYAMKLEIGSQRRRRTATTY